MPNGEFVLSRSQRYEILKGREREPDRIASSSQFEMTESRLPLRGFGIL